MPAAREEFVRRINERWNAGDREIREEEADPEIEIDEQFGTWRTRLDDFAQATDERLLVLGSIHFRGRASGIELEVPVGWLYEFRGDRVLRMTTFATHDEGRRAAGVA